MVVFKYSIKPNCPKVQIPKKAEVLSVGFQGNELFLWAKVNPDLGDETRYFHGFLTGEELPLVGLVFHGTAHTDSGLVFHVFEQLSGS